MANPGIGCVVTEASCKARKLEPSEYCGNQMVLDLGCGERKINGAIGVDSRSLPGVDFVHDLACFPYPFGDDSADVIHANHVLEHLPDVMATMQELWRICKPGAKVHIRVPHFTGILAWRDPTHRRCFSSDSFLYFGQNEFSYTPARFNVVSLRLVYSVQPIHGVLRRALARVVQRMIDLHPTFGERHLAYLIGGIDEIQVVLVAVKAGSR